jgi:hypothetical protein
MTIRALTGGVIVEQWRNYGHTQPGYVNEVRTGPRSTIGVMTTTLQSQGRSCAGLYYWG